MSDDVTKDFGDEAAADDPFPHLPEGTVDRDDVLVQALERAQKAAARRGYMRTSVGKFYAVPPEKTDVHGGTTEWQAIPTDSGDIDQAVDVLLMDVNAESAAPASSPEAAELTDDATQGRGTQADAETASDRDRRQIAEELGALARATLRAGHGWAKAPGMAATRPHYRQVKSLGSLVQRLDENPQWRTGVRMGRVMSQWEDIVGSDIAAHTHVETFTNHVLVVRCTSTAWAQQLKFLLPQIERRIEVAVGQGVVKQVVIKGPVGRSWKHGPLSVKGRGPRDTYG